jgi:phosphoribosylglycinamide formyltransferase-1
LNPASAARPVNGPAYRIGVFASGGGSNLQALIDRIRTGELPVELAFVLSNNSKSGALEKARAFGTKAYHVSALTEGGEDGAAARMAEIVKAHRIDLLVLAGYMKKVPDVLMEILKNRILNIHPGMLPAFGGEGYYGHKVHEAVIARGCQFSGLTIHMVNGDYDAGQIVWQRVVPVDPHWTAERLGAEILKEEHACYWRVVRGFALGEIAPTGSDDPAKAVDASRFLERMAHDAHEPAA